MKKIFKIDAALYLLGVLTALSGFGFHIAGHGGDMHQWAIWACIHSIIAIVFLVMIIQHLITHKGWIKALKKQEARQKRSVKITCFLGLLALVVAISGLTLFAIDGANSHIGVWHYKLGIIFTIFAIGHAAKRFHILRKAIRR